MAKFVYNPETLLYEPTDTPRRVKVARVLILIVLALGLVVLYAWLYTGVFGFELPKTARLRHENAEWQARADLLSGRLDKYETVLSGIENRDDDVYRSIFGLSPLSGVYGSKGPDSLRTGADLLSVRVDALSRRTYARSKSLDEVHQLSLQAGDMLSCLPSVPPILPKKGSYRISSPFGRRVDPVYGGGEFHHGLDFATDKGNPVYATGDGVVEKAECKFSGYGNEVVINHGYGYKTRYAHLSIIDVGVGMKVTRGERIGAVGNSGKSTGPHLHYEVVYKGNTVNPMKYMDLSMPVEEYQSMISTRVDEQPRDKRSSTSELLNRRKQ